MLLKIILRYLILSSFQGRRKIFYGGEAGGGLSKIFLSKKKRSLKRSKAVPRKTKLDQNISDSKSHIWIPFLKILFWAYNFVIFVHTFRWTSSGVFFNFRFSRRKFQSQQKLEKRSLILQYSFAQKTSLILQTSTHLT